MKRSNLWTWTGATLLGMALAGTASADPWDRERETGRMRANELRSTLAQREGMSGRPDGVRSVTGREMGRNTIERGDYKREFRDRNDMMSHVDERTKQRAEKTAAARGGEDGSDSGKTFPNAGHTTVSSPVEFQAKQAQAQLRAQTAQEEGRITKTITGREMGHNTLNAGDVYRDSKTRNEMMSHLNTQTAIRASKTEAAAGGEDADKSRAFPNAGAKTSDPTKLTDAERKGLAALGFVAAAKGQASSDIEDKAR